MNSVHYLRKALLSTAIASIVVLSAWDQPAYSAGIPTMAVSSLQLIGGAVATGIDDPPNKPENFAGLDENPIKTGADVGYLPSSWNVSSSGAFAFSIPLDVPDGRVGMQPGLSLAYSSANVGNGPLGVGWSLSGLSNITRCGQNLTVDGVVAADGRFCLDGAKLVALPDAAGNPGAYGLPGTEYRTESESYARITTTGALAFAPEKFLVETRSGITREYGRVNVPEQKGTYSSVIEPQISSNGPLPDAPQSFAVEPALVADRWLLKLERDKSGNTVEYIWNDLDPDAIDPVTQGIELLVKEIRYTANTQTGATPLRKVVFEYDNSRTDKEFAWRLGIRTEVRNRLKSITMHAPNPRATMPVWTYLLTYQPSPSLHSGRSRLWTVERCGLTAPSALSTDYDYQNPSHGGCLWKKEFEWYDTPAMPSFVSKSIPSGYALTLPPYDPADPTGWANKLAAALHPPVGHVLDLDGDGSDDMVMQYSDGAGLLPTKILRGERQPNGVVNPLAAQSAIEGAYYGGVKDEMLLQSARPVDLDMDGKFELLAARRRPVLDGFGNPDPSGQVNYSEQLYEWSTTAQPPTFGPSQIPPLFGIHYGAKDLKNFNFLDLNGDRYLDLVVEADGPDNENQGGFFSWNKKWETWVNNGGGGALSKVSPTQLETRCPSQVTDSDGDGRAELVQRYDEMAETGIIDPGPNVAWATPTFHEESSDNDPIAPQPGYKQYECKGIGYIRGLSDFDAPDPTPQRKNGKEEHARNARRSLVPQVDYGDFNGDGLEDEFVYQYDQSQEGRLNAWVRWNSGNGYGPFVAISNYFPTVLDNHWQVRQLVLDANGDGRDDLLSLRRHDDAVPGSPGAADFMVLKLSDGKGGFSDNPIDGGGGVFDELATYTTTRTGDFNADGFPDVIRFKSPTTLELLEQSPHFSDRIMAVRDQPTMWDRQMIYYSTRWSDKPEAVVPCAYPLSCIKRGMPVVREVETRDHLVDPTQAEIISGARTLYYSYEDPVSDLRGRGFLGFRKFRVWDWARPMESVQEFDNRTRVGDQPAPNFAYGKYYPGVSTPIKTTTVIPFAWPSGQPSGSNSDTLPIATGTARVVRTYATPKVKALNKLQIDDDFGLTYDVHTEAWETKEWEEPVSIDWGVVNAAENPTSEHIFAVMSPDPGPNSAPDPLLRRRSGTMAFDNYGNLTNGHSKTDGGIESWVGNTYHDPLGTWQIGKLHTQKSVVADADNDPPAVERNSEYFYDGLGRLEHAVIEPNQAGTSLNSTTYFAYDDYGNVKKVSASALNDSGVTSERTTRIEYTPPKTDWASEYIYPSQVWAPFIYAPVDYRPSAWVAVHPAFGVPVATMNVNGVQSQTTYDDLGRVLSSKSDGSPLGTVTYAGRPDANGANGKNGLIITSKLIGLGNDGQTAEIQTDGLGRTLRSSSLGFDGVPQFAGAKRDILGRLISVSRPYTGATPTQFTTYTYDGLDRLLKQTRPDGTFSRVEPSFFKTTSWDASNNKSYSIADVDGRLITSANELPGVVSILTTYDWGPLGIDRVIDDAGNVTHTEYDLLGRPIAQDDPDTGRSEVEYSGFSEVLKRTHVKSGDVTSMRYDALGRLMLQTGPKGETTLFAYDTMPYGIGALAQATSQATSPDEVVSKYAYDAVSGRATGFEQTVDGKTYRVGMSYDAIGRLYALLYPSVDGSLTPGFRTQYMYNDFEYVSRIDTQQPGQGLEKLWQVNSRNLDGALLSGDLGPNGAQAFIKRERFYEPLTGRLDIMKDSKGNVPLLNLDYDYYANGMVKSRNESVMNRMERFDYDAMLRLTHWTLTHNGTDRVTDYEYDPIGNLKKVWSGQYPAGQIANAQQLIESNSYGNTDGSQPHTLTKHSEPLLALDESYHYDARGRQDQGGGRSTVFTDFDLPKKLTKDGKDWEFVYDAFGSRVKKSGPDGTTVYVAGIFEMRAVPGQPTKHVFHLSGTDGKLAEVVYDGSKYSTNFVLQDMLGSNGVVVNTAGAVTDRNFYDPFGRRTNANGAPCTPQAPCQLNPEVTDGFTGHEHEEAFGLINMRGRMYDPKLKRFISADPFVTHPGFGQSWNHYSYVMNSPLNFSDPTGFQDKKICIDETDKTTCETYGSGSFGNGGSAPQAPGAEDDCGECVSKEPYVGDPNMGPSTSWAGSGVQPGTQPIGKTPGIGTPAAKTPKADTKGAGAQGGPTGQQGGDGKVDPPFKSDYADNIQTGEDVEVLAKMVLVGSILAEVGLVCLPCAKAMAAAGILGLGTISHHDEPGAMYKMAAGAGGIKSLAKPPVLGGRATGGVGKEEITLSGGDGKSTMAHGNMIANQAGADVFTVPQGARVTVMAPGKGMTGQVARMIQSGDWGQVTKILQAGPSHPAFSQLSGMRTQLPGSVMPRYQYSPAPEFVRLQNSGTVTSPIPINGLVTPGSGHWCLTACTAGPRGWWIFSLPSISGP